jgi:hypothetical protein
LLRDTGFRELECYSIVVGIQINSVVQRKNLSIVTKYIGVADGDAIHVGSIDIDVVVPYGHVAEGSPTSTKKNTCPQAFLCCRLTNIYSNEIQRLTVVSYNMELR